MTSTLPAPGALPEMRGEADLTGPLLHHAVARSTGWHRASFSRPWVFGSSPLRGTIRPPLLVRTTVSDVARPMIMPFTKTGSPGMQPCISVSYTHLRAHETGRNLVCRLLL